MSDMIDLARIFYVVGATLFAIALICIVFYCRKNSKNVKETSNPKPNLETFTLETVYLHKLTLPSIDSAIRLLKTLNKKGIAATLISRGEGAIIQFINKKPLKNAEELKKKGFIKNYEIVEVFPYDA